MYIDKCRLFAGLTKSQAMRLLEAEGTKRICFKKGEVVLREGEKVNDFCIIESGTLEGVRYLVDGLRDVAAVLTEGDVFGDVLAISGGRRSPVTVIARTESYVVFIPFDLFFSGIGGEVNAKVLKNLIHSVSDKYFALQFRINCIACRSLREKIMYYLVTVGGHSKEPFNIPLDREALADFLCTDRSALSRELSSLRKDGIIDYYKNTFKLKQNILMCML